GYVDERLILAPFGAAVGAHARQQRHHLGKTGAEANAIAFAAVGGDERIEQNFVRAEDLARLAAIAAFECGARVRRLAVLTLLADVIRNEAFGRIEFEEID